MGNEKYIQNSLQLWSPKPISGTASIGPGSFSFRFQFIIPSHVPSSFYDKYTGAYISYKIQACAETGLFQINYEDSATIYISRPTSINGAKWTTPLSLVERKQVGCLCCAAGNVEFVAKLPRTGYCITNHDTIPLVVNVHNNSTRVIQMRAKIFQKVSMFVRWEKNVCRKTVAEIFSESIQPGDSYEWSPTNWSISRISPTIVESRILQVEYILEVSAVIPKALNLRCNIPLLMGNQPYTSSDGLERALLGAIMAVMLQSRTSASSRNDVEEEELNDHNSSERDTLI